MWRGLIAFGLWTWHLRRRNGRKISTDIRTGVDTLNENANSNGHKGQQSHVR